MAQRIIVNDAPVTSAAPSPGYTPDLFVTGSITTQNLVPAGAPTAGSAVQVAPIENMHTCAIQVTGTYTGALSVQVEADNATWVTLVGAAALTNVVPPLRRRPLLRPLSG
jgi:hypothetical protein